MAKMKWHEAGTKELEAGVKEVALFVMNDAGTAYTAGVPWNGVTGITENPGGADKTDLYADDEKYATLRGTETYSFGIEAYTYPDEWAECDGSKEVADGVFIGQQTRKAFALAYKTSIGDDAHPGMDKGYKLHIVWNSSAAPSSRGYTTINDNPDAITFSWDADSTPVACTGHKSVSTITIDSTKANAEKLAALEAVLYGQDADVENEIEATNATMLTPDQVIAALTVSAATTPAVEGDANQGSTTNPPAGDGNQTSNP